MEFINCLCKDDNAKESYEPNVNDEENWIVTIIDQADWHIKFHLN